MHCALCALVNSLKVPIADDYNCFHILFVFLFSFSEYDIYLWVYQCTMPVIIPHSAWKSSPLLFWAPMKEPLKKNCFLCSRERLSRFNGEMNIMFWALQHTVLNNNKRSWASSWKLNLKCRENWFSHKVLEQNTQKKLFHFQRSNILCCVAKAWVVFSHLSAMKNVDSLDAVYCILCTLMGSHLIIFSRIHFEIISEQRLPNTDYRV